MGTDKAGLRLGGKSFLTRIRSTAREAGLMVRVIRRDLVTGCGPLGGVHTALRTTQANAVLFLSCDMPFVTGSLLQRLQKRFTAQQAAVFVQHEQLGFPFLIRRTALPVVEAQLFAGRFSLNALAQVLNASRLQVHSSQEVQALVNVNTPQEYEAAQQFWAQAQKRLAS
jgi:molybdenum cofactor guanylyltransferase